MTDQSPVPGDLDRLLNFVGEIHGSLELDDFRVCLLDALSRLITSDWVSLNDVRPPPAEMAVLSQPPAPEELHGAWDKFGHQNPLIQRFQRTQDGRAYRFSDVVSPAELHGLDLYREVYAPLGIGHQIAVVVHTGSGGFLGLALSRRGGDYSDLDRRLLDRARPHIVQAHRNALLLSARPSEATGRAAVARHLTETLQGRQLSVREAEVVAGLAVGRSVTEVASALTISPRTVNKHLQGSYRKLGVTSRTAAATAAWRLVERGE